MLPLIARGIVVVVVNRCGYWFAEVVLNRSTKMIVGSEQTHKSGRIQHA